jgi:hypothetical protein
LIFLSILFFIFNLFILIIILNFFNNYFFENKSTFLKKYDFVGKKIYIFLDFWGKIFRFFFHFF